MNKIRFITALPLILFVNFCFSQLAYAESGLYIGFDALRAQAKHRVRNFTGGDSFPHNSEKRNNTEYNYGVNLGYRIDPLPAVVFAELFYDNLDINSHNFSSNSTEINPSDRIHIKNRYGAKINMGLNFIPGIAPFITYGLVNIRYQNNLQQGDKRVSKTEFSPLYGFGILVDLPITDLALKASYDIQSFTMNYAGENANIRSYLSIVKLGLLYKF